MNISVGDKFTLDGVEMEIEAAAPDVFWFKEVSRGYPHYFHIFCKTKPEFEELIKSGRLKLGTNSKITPGTKPCNYHAWKKYVGAREVYNFCTFCGAKERKDWRLIKDDKEY